jgi:Arabinose-binding domain of AraC transcription regulator, N-term
MEVVGLTEKVFSAAKITAVVDKLALDGASSADALADADLSLVDLNIPATRISRNQLIQCYRNAIALSRDPHLAFAIGSSVHLSAYGMYGYAMLCSPISAAPWTSRSDTISWRRLLRPLRSRSVTVSGYGRSNR